MSPAVRRTLEQALNAEQLDAGYWQSQEDNARAVLAQAIRHREEAEATISEIRAALDGEPADVPVPLDLEQDGDR